MTNIEVTDKSGFDWNSAGVNPGELIRLTAFLLPAMQVSTECEVSISLVTKVDMEKLHMRWMGESGATDVLSFPMDDLRPGVAGEPPPVGILGDVILCPEVAQAQATEAGHSLDVELQILMTHGVLHLLGYDHATPDEHAQMFDIQNDLLLRWRATFDGSGGGA